MLVRMATSPRERLDRELERIDSLEEQGELPDGLHPKLYRFARTLDKANTAHRMKDRHGDTVALEPRSVEVYLRCLRIVTTGGLDLLSDGASEFNALMDAWNESGKRSKRTLNTYQAAARRFYRCFDLGVDPSDITTFRAEALPKHDEADMFTEDEVWALRRACGRTRMPTRNRAFLELLIFSGQRIRALLTLRRRDVDVETGHLYLNDEVDGLKGALRRGRRRPIFGARKYVRDWLEAHPFDDPGAWLFVGDPNHWKTDLDDHWAGPTADQVLRRIGTDAGVDKPVNAHNFRHYCVTVLRRDYDRDWEEINALVGVVKGSDLPKTTYSHIGDDALTENIEEAMGYKESEESNRFAPPVCPTCAEVLKPHWRECPSCRELFAPDGRELQDDAKDELAESLGVEDLTAKDRERAAAVLKRLLRAD